MAHARYISEQTFSNVCWCQAALSFYSYLLAPRKVSAAIGLQTISATVDQGMITGPVEVTFKPVVDAHLFP
jgi:hypothetical protein